MMNQQDIFKKIGSILIELNEQYQFLAQNPENLNDLELELFLANANFLTDHVQIIQKLNGIKHQSQQPAEIEQDMDKRFENNKLEEISAAEEEEERVDALPKEERLDQERIYADTAEKVIAHDFFKPDQDDHTFEFVLGHHDTDENDRFDYEEKSVEQIFDRPLSQAEQEILAQKKKIQEQEDFESDLTFEQKELPIEEDEIGPEPFLIAKEEYPDTIQAKPQVAPVEEEPIVPVEAKYDDPIISPPVEERPAFIPEAVPVKPIVQPIQSKSAPTLNELLAKSNQPVELPKTPVTDLKQAINLNEKLLFIKDLFNGYNLAYSEAIDLVNKMNSFEAADAFLQSNYAVKNNWASKQSTVDQLYLLLNSRFS